MRKRIIPPAFFLLFALSFILCAFSSAGAARLFDAPLCFRTGGAPYSVCAGDFNEDGIIDLAVANNSSDYLSVLIGNGDCTFKAALNYSTGDESESIITADFNGDGLSDLAVANYGSDDLSVLRSRGQGRRRRERRILRFVFALGIVCHV